MREDGKNVEYPAYEYMEAAEKMEHNESLTLDQIILKMQTCQLSPLRFQSVVSENGA